MLPQRPTPLRRIRPWQRLALSLGLVTASWLNVSQAAAQEPGSESLIGNAKADQSTTPAPGRDDAGLPAAASAAALSQVLNGPSERGQIASLRVRDRRRGTSSQQGGAAPAELPVIRSEAGFNLHQALRLPDWTSLKLTGLSQTNGTISGLSPAQATSSNLFDLDLQIGPFTVPRTEESTQQGLATGANSNADQSDAFWRKLSVNALLTQRLGGILSNEIPNILNTQWNYGNGPISRLNSLSVQYQNPNGLLSMVKAGKLMQAQDFTVNPVQCYFSNFGVCGWAQGTPYMVPIPGNPFNSYGAVVEIGNSNQATLKYGIYQLAPSTFAPQYHGLNFRFDQGIGTAHFLEATLPIGTPTLLPVISDASGRNLRSSLNREPNAYYQTDLPAGVITLGGWLAQGRFARIDPAGATDSAVNQPQNNGLYGITSFRLPLDSIALDNRFFLSAGAGLNPGVQQFSSGGSAGLVLAGVLASRPFDTLSLGMSYATYNPDFYLSGTTTDRYQPQTEIALELNYDINLSRAVSIMPNIQLILNPEGDSTRAAVVVGGLQVWLSF